MVENSSAQISIMLYNYMLQREETSFVRKTKIYFYYIFFIYKMYKYIRKLGYFLG